MALAAFVAVGVVAYSLALGAAGVGLAGLWPDVARWPHDRLELAGIRLAGVAAVFSVYVFAGGRWGYFLWPQICTVFWSISKVGSRICNSMPALPSHRLRRGLIYCSLPCWAGMWASMRLALVQVVLGGRWACWELD